MALRTETLTAEPVTLEQAKLHLRVDISEDDSRIRIAIQKAREWVESYVQRQMIQADSTVYLDFFPCGSAPINLPKPPLVEVTEIRYIDTAGVQQTFTDFDYDPVGYVGRVYPTFGKVWPATRLIPNAVEIDMTHGYGASGSSVPACLIEAMLLLISHSYENREPVLIGSISKELEFTIESNLSDFRARGTAT